MVQKDGESYLSFCERVTNSLIEGKISYEKWSESILKERLYGAENLRRCAVFFNKFLSILDKEEIKTLNDEGKIERLEMLKHQIQKERKKLQEENREYQANIRENARGELFSEKVLAAIHNLQPIQFGNHIKEFEKIDTTGVLVVSDLHYDSTYELKGIYGEIINKYDANICKARMNTLLDKIAAEANIPYDELLVVFNGDLLENVLRMSSLVKLRHPVVDSVIEISEFLAQWLNQLQTTLEIPVKVAIVGGNHSIMRPLGSKPIDERENLEKIIQKFVELRLQNHPYITVEPYTDAYFTTIHMNNLLFVHGEDADLSATMDYCENYYNVDIDYIIAGHFHRGEIKSNGVGNVADREIIRVPSICGTDTYAKKMHKHSRAGATFMTFTIEGRSWSKNFYLN